jgi:hypothetical protein
MKNIIKMIICICAVSHEIAVGQTTNYVGTWSNKKSDFSKIAFGLRLDGRGFFFASIGSTILRWTNSTNGIDLRIANGGSSTNLSLLYDPLTDRFSAFDGPKWTQVFYRENTNEPPDLESKNEARQAKEYEDQLRSYPVTNLSTYADFKNRAQFLTNENNGMQILFATSANKKTIIFKKIGKLNSITLITIEAGTIPKGVGASEQPVQPEGDFQTNIFATEDRITKLRTWLESKGAKCDYVYCVYRSPWRVEGYRRLCEISILNNSSLFMDAVTNIVEDAFAPFEFPVEAR